MSSPRNTFSLIGNVGKDPELKTTGSNTAYCNISIAVNKRFKDEKGETKTITNWFSVTLWGKKAETLSKYIKKGSTIAVMGEMVTRKRKFGDDEKEYSIPDFKVDQVEILSGGKTGGGSSDDESGSDDNFGDDIND